MRRHKTPEQLKAWRAWMEAQRQRADHKAFLEHCLINRQPLPLLTPADFGVLLEASDDERPASWWDRMLGRVGQP